MTDHKPKTDWKDKLSLSAAWAKQGRQLQCRRERAKGRPEQAPGSRENPANTASFTPEHTGSIHKHKELISQIQFSGSLLVQISYNMVSDAIVLPNANFLQESRMNFHRMGKCGNAGMDAHGEQGK